MPQADGSDGIYGRAEEPGSPQLTLEEIRAGVEDAHKANRRSPAHAYSVAAITNALYTGVDSIERGRLLDRETAKRYARRESTSYPRARHTPQ